MQVKEIENKGLSHELEVKVPAQDIDKKRTARLQEVGKTVSIQGFRKGKVPIQILEKKYGRAIMGEVLELVVNESATQVLSDKKLRPAMQPKIEVKEFDEGKDLTFSLKVDVLPDIKVMELKGLKLEKPVAKISKKEIDEALERIAQNNKGSQKIEGDRATKKGDILVIDFHGRTKDDGVQHEGMHAHGAKLELGSGQFIPGFEDQLIGKKAGEKVEVEVQFPADYGASHLAGREAIFDVDVHEIHEPADAKIDEDFAKMLGFSDEKALRDAIEEQMKKEYDGLSRLKLKRALLDMLDEGHQFDVPPSMLDAEYDMILKQIEQERKMNPVDGSSDVSDEEKEELKEIADRRVRLGLVLSEVGNAHSVSITPQDLQRAVIAEAQKFPGQEKVVFDFYQKNQQALDSLRAPIFEDKVVEIIFGMADISDKEVSVEELTAEDMEDEIKPKKKKAAKSSRKKA